MNRTLLVGTAGWTIPRAEAARFVGEGPHLERYGRVLCCAEINSSFKGSHRFEVYRRWSELTPPGFRFSVKMPAEITHVGRLRKADAALDLFLAQAAGLGDKLAVLLVQLPPSLAFEAEVARDFFRGLRRRFDGGLVCEPRHPSWLEPDADALLVASRVGRVAADPARVPAFGVPGGWLGAGDSGPGAVVYCRLHGAPRVYWSRYEPGDIALWAERMASIPATAEAWCIFDNTASGAALGNAVELTDALLPRGGGR